MIKCSLDFCDRNSLSQVKRGLCNGHRVQERQGRQLSPLREMIVRYPEDARCSFPDCTGRPKANWLCSPHDAQIRKGMELQPLRSINWIERESGYVTKQYWKNGKLVRVQQHRWVMEQSLGRPLLPSENVHHLNGVRSDNRIENLELWSKAQPSGQRVSDKIRWALELLALYGDDPEAYEIDKNPEIGTTGNKD